MERLLKFFMLCALALVTTFVVSCINHKKPVNDAVEEIDTCEQNYEYPAPTVQDIIQERNEMLFMAKIDSIYMAMPEQILVNILVNKGTELGIIDIVEEYLDRKTYYNDTILKTIKIDRKYIPDSTKKSLKPTTNPIEPYEKLRLIILFIGFLYHSS